MTAAILLHPLTYIKPFRVADAVRKKRKNQAFMWDYLLALPGGIV
jgi:hypothetical protein